MAKRGGIQGYTVQEAQNVSMGQAGTAFVSDNNTYEPPTGSVVVAIQAMVDCVLVAATTVSEGSNYVDGSNAGPGTAGNALSTLTIPAGMTIYGRFIKVDFSGSPEAILYLG